MQQFVFQVDEPEQRTRLRVSTVINGSAFFSRGSVLLLLASLVAQQRAPSLTESPGTRAAFMAVWRL
jgi:hypothetical protein